MTLSTADLLDATGAQFVAGDAIAIVNGKSVVLGRNTRDGVILTEEGVLLAETLAPAPTPVRRTRVSRGEAPAAEPVVEGEPTNLTLGLKDETLVAEKLG